MVSRSQPARQRCPFIVPISGTKHFLVQPLVIKATCNQKLATSRASVALPIAVFGGWCQKSLKRSLPSWRAACFHSVAVVLLAPDHLVLEGSVPRL